MKQQPPTRINLRTPPRRRTQSLSHQSGIMRRFVQAVVGPLPVTIGALVALVALLTFVPFDTSPDKEWHWVGLFRLAMLMSSIVLCLTLAIFVHEIGHFIVGKLLGYRFIWFSAGPMIIISNGQRIRVLANNKWAVSGLSLLVPIDDHHLVRREILFILSGPLASLVLGIAALYTGITMETQREIYNWRNIAHTFAWTTGMFSSFLFGLSLPPYSSSHHASDGERLFMLIRGGPLAERWIALRRTMGAHYSGYRAREWNRTWMEQLIAQPDHSPEDITGNLYVYYWALDSHKIKFAGECIDHALGEEQSQTRSHSALLWAEAAYYEARYRKNAETATSFLESARRNRGSNSMIAIGRAEAALKLAQNKPDEVLVWVERTLEMINQQGLQNTKPGQAEIEWVEDIRKQIDGKQAPKPEESER